MKTITWVSRILVGVLFIISGLIKANDTIGFSYKLVEYFEIFGMPYFVSMAVPLAMVICIFEILSGVALLLGIYARFNAILLLLLIIFFTLLTGYSAITHKVTDCGCFGDAIKLKPFESFMKDVVLLVLILFILKGIKHVKPLFNQVIQHIALFTCLIVSTFFTLYTYMFLPVIDFLPYKVGNNIQQQTIIPEGAPRDEVKMTYIYEKGGETFMFDVNQLPENLDSFHYVDRQDVLIKEGFKPPIHDFKLYDGMSTEVTDSFFNTGGYKLVITQLQIENSRPGIAKQLKELTTKWLAVSGRTVWAITSTSFETAEKYASSNGLPFHYLNMDGTPIKSMVRSNPGVLLLKDNVVVKKWGAFNLPTYETVMKLAK